MFIAEITPIHGSLIGPSLSYLSKENLKPGNLVKIPLRKKQVLGVILSVSNARDFKQNIRKQNFTIKHIDEKIKQELFSPEYIQSLLNLSAYWHLPLGKCIEILHSKKIRDNIDDFLYTPTQQKKKSEKKITELFYLGNADERKAYFIKIFSESNNSIHIICPTKHTALNLHKKLKKDSPHINFFLLHSGSSIEKITKAKKQLEKEPGILISTPLFLDLIQKNISHIILEEAGSPYYRRHLWPELDSRIFIEKYASLKKINFLRADSLLSPSFFWGEKSTEIPQKNFFQDKKIQLFNLKHDTFKKTDAERIKELEEKKSFQLIHPKIVQIIEKKIQEHKQIFCYVSKKNLASTIICERCGSLAQDLETHIPYRLSLSTTSNEKKTEFIQVQSGEKLPAFDSCQFCSGRLHGFGIGTEKVQEFLNKQLPHASTAIIDGNNNTKQTEIRSALQADIIIGTLKALPYTENIKEQIVISLDSHFAHMNYDADFNILRILTIMNERSNDGVVVQSRNILHQKLPFLRGSDYSHFVQKELDLATEYHTPPAITSFKIEHLLQESEISTWSQYYHEHFSQYGIHMKIFNKNKKKILHVTFACKKNDWNPEYQESKIKEWLPTQNHDIHISINPQHLF